MFHSLTSQTQQTTEELLQHRILLLAAALYFARRDLGDTPEQAQSLVWELLEKAEEA